MKGIYLTLLVASSLCLELCAVAKDAVIVPRQQNNCVNQKGGANIRNAVNLKNRANIAVQSNAGRQIGFAKSDEPKVSVEQKNDNKKSSSQKGEHPIDIVICLDTSSSMDGLIVSAKQKIWDIVNELAVAKPKPHLRVGLYAYGTPSFGAESGFVRKELALTDDLDKVFAELTALRTTGGDEYCARVISTAAKEQPWADDKKALKIVVLSGNESATQDPKLNVFDVAKDAIKKGIIINTIYCGPASHPESSEWRKIATAADGQFAAIDQDRGTVVVSTPFDQKLAELGSKINTTYLAYGRNGYSGQQKQQAADAMSSSLGASNVASRAMAKVSGQYRNSSWDLLDASSESDFSLAKIKKEELPAEMQKMSADERKGYLAKKATERAEIQKQIADLNTQRAKFIQEELKKSGKSNDKAFDTAMLKALREQAQKTGFTF